MEKAKKAKASAKKGMPIAHGVGRRKKAIARVWLRHGTGSMTINGRQFDAYFDTKITQSDAQASLQAAGVSSDYAVDVNVIGGGSCAQAGAVRLGVARALLEINSELRPVLKQKGFLTVDARNKERKKYGQPGARKKFQFVKR